MVIQGLTSPGLFFCSVFSHNFSSPKLVLHDIPSIWSQSVKKPHALTFFSSLARLCGAKRRLWRREMCMLDTNLVLQFSLFYQCSHNNFMISSKNSQWFMIPVRHLIVWGILASIIGSVRLRGRFHVLKAHLLCCLCDSVKSLPLNVFISCTLCFCSLLLKCKNVLISIWVRLQCTQPLDNLILCRMRICL